MLRAGTYESESMTDMLGGPNVAESSIGKRTPRRGKDRRESTHARAACQIVAALRAAVKLTAMPLMVIKRRALYLSPSEAASAQRRVVEISLRKEEVPA